MRHSTYFARRYSTCSSIFIRRQRAREAIVAIVLAAFSIFPAASQTLQPPDEEFYLQTMYADSNHVFGVIDSKNAANAVTGVPQLNPLRDPNNPSTVGSPKSQWWRDILLLTGDTDSVKLKNDATGQCIGDLGDFDTPTATLMSCDDSRTIWNRSPQGHGISYRRPYPVGGPVGGVTGGVEQDCLMTSPVAYPGLLVLGACQYTDVLPDFMVWSRTTSPIATVSTAITPAPPPVPPIKPTACKLDGAAVCGQVQFTCDSLSASDTIVVPSGMIGVKVTSVQANIGMINATYLNTGQARIAICATKQGLSACSSAMAVSFGPTLCPAPPPPPGPACPTGQEICRGTCVPFGSCTVVR